MKNYKVSLSVLFILIISSFYPMVQIMLLYLNGCLLALLAWILGLNHSSGVELSIVFHLGMALIFYCKYFKSEVDFSKICNAVLIIFFMNGLICFSDSNAFESAFASDNYIYFFLASAFVIVIPLLIIDFIKREDKLDEMEYFETVLDSEEIFHPIKNS